MSCSSSTTKTYLSIDVDYWSSRHTDWDQSVREMWYMFDRVVKSGVPVTMVLDHHELLEDPNINECNKLINVDYHSDITNYFDEDGEIKYIEYGTDAYCKAELNCGTWVNFLPWRSTGEFLWCYPESECFSATVRQANYGRCEDVDGFWDKPKSKHHNWNYISCVRGWQYKVDWRNVTAVGVSMSVEWLQEYLETHFIWNVYPKLEANGVIVSDSFLEYLSWLGGDDNKELDCRYSCR